MTFAAPPPAALFALPGVRELHRDGNTVRVQASDSIDAVIKAVARYEIVDLRTEQPNLEDVFLAFYSEHGGGDAEYETGATICRELACSRSRCATSAGRSSASGSRWRSMSSTAVFLWPSVRDTLQNFELPAAVKAFLGTDLSIATAAGYLSARYFGWIDILLIVYAVIQGTGAIAGEESSGTMDLLLAQPIARRDVIAAEDGGRGLGCAR